MSIEKNLYRCNLYGKNSYTKKFVKMENLEKILSNENFNSAWNKIKAKNATFGIDQVTIDEFNSNYNENIEQLRNSVLSEEYIPEPYKMILIKKNPDEFRPIAILTLKDKLLQLVLVNYFSQLTNRMFTDTNYAYRPNKGHVKAIKRVRDFLIRKNNWVAHIDIDNYFDTIDRALLLDKVKAIIENPKITRLFQMWIETGVVYHGKYFNLKKGIAQGGVISPWLSNIYLNDFDHTLLERKINNVRYSDNILLLAKSKEQIEEHFRFVQNYLKTELGLKINKDKSFITNYSEGFDFLGIRFENNLLKMCNAKLEEKKANAKKLIINTSFENIPEKFKPVIQGILNYYYQFDAEEELLELSEHIIRELTVKSMKENISKRNVIETIYKLNLASIVANKSNSYFVSYFYNFFNARKSEEKNTEAIRRKIEIKSRKYVNVIYENLNLVVSTSFATIGKKYNSFVVKKQGKILDEVFASKIKSLIIGQRDYNKFQCS